LHGLPAIAELLVLCGSVKVGRIDEDVYKHTWKANIVNAPLPSVPQYMMWASSVV